MSFGQQYNIFDDLNALKRMIGSLENYLEGNDIYGSVGGGFLTGGTLPSLTIGAILMRLRRLEALRGELDEDRQNTLGELRERHAHIRQEHESQYVERMEREAHSRLDSMQRFFEECARNPAACAQNYGPEVLRRTITQEILLAMEIDDIHSAELDDKVKMTDRKLRVQVQDSDFIWDTQLQPVYPQETFWWMYMRPRG